MADGSVIIDVGLDDSEFKAGAKEVKREVAKLAAEYRKAGDTASDSFTKAWNDVKNGKSVAKDTGSSLSTYIGGGATDATDKINRMTASLEKIGQIIGTIFAVEKIVDFGKACIELGSDVAEVQNVVDVAFGEMVYKAEDFAERAITQFGMSTLAAKRTSSTYMAMARGMGVAEDAASDMSISLAELSGDVASFFNISQELADIKLRSVFTGETETLKDLGVVMTQDNLKAYALSQGITTAYNSMSQAEQVALRYNFVMDALSLSIGDFARTQDSWANQTRILSMQWQEFMSIIGQALTTVLLPLVRVLNQVVSWLITAANAFNVVITSIFGGASKEVQQTGTYTDSVGDSIGIAVDNQDALTDAVKETNKEQAKSLAGFDEIYKLADDTSTAFSDGASGGGFSASSGADFSDSVRGGTFSVEVTGVDDVDWTERFSGLYWAYENVLVPLGQWVGNELLPRFFDLLSASLEFFGAVVEKLKPVFLWFWDNVLTPLANFVGDAILSFLDTFTKRLQQLTDVLNGDMSLTEFIADLSAIEKIIVAITVAYLGLKAIDAVIGVFDTTTKFFKDLSGLKPAELLKELTKKFLGLGTESDAASKSLDKTSKSTSTLTEKIKNGLATFGLIGGITLSVEAFLSMWENGCNMIDETLMLIGLAIGAVCATVLGVPAIVSGVVAGIIAVLATVILWIKTNNEELWNDITAWFQQHVAPKFTIAYWKNKFGTIKDAMVSVIDGVKSTVSNAVSWITDKLNIKAKITADTSSLKTAAATVSTQTALQQSMPTITAIGNAPTLNIPMLAQGAVIPPNSQFLAVLGDQKSGINIETPLETMKQAFVEAMQESDIGGGTYKFEIYLNGRKMAVEMVKEVNSMTRAAGKPVILF